LAYKRLTYHCGFCRKRKYREQDKPKYIYPVPVSRLVGQTKDNREGSLACGKCTKKVEAQQKRLKLVADAPAGRFPILRGKE